jgi:dolichol-phosphate mannosyltransferase
MRQTLVAVATYNEIDNLPRLVGPVFEVLPQADVLVVDDNSPDGTGRWCDEFAARDPRLSCLHRPGKQGLGTATLAALRCAIDRDYQYTVTMDADLSHDPRYLPDLLASMNPFGQEAMDVMIGSRYVAHGGIRGWPWRRRFMSRAINLYARCLLGLRVRDCSSAFRCYRTARLRQLDLDQIRSRGFAVFEELLWHLQRAGARIGELPIVFVDRDRGRSKISTREALSAVRTMTQLGLQRLGSQRPRDPGQTAARR